MANVHVDFTASNAYAIALWAVKHANHYFDQQLIDVFDGLIRQASVINYKSNKRTFGDDEWKWHARPLISNVFSSIIALFSTMRVASAPHHGHMKEKI